MIMVSGWSIFISIVLVAFFLGRVTMRVEYGMSKFWYESWKLQELANGKLRMQLREFRTPYR